MIIVCGVPNLNLLVLGGWMALTRGDGLEEGSPCSSRRHAFAAKVLGDQQAALRIGQALISLSFNRLYLGRTTHLCILAT